MLSNTYRRYFSYLNSKDKPQFVLNAWQQKAQEKGHVRCTVIHKVEWCLAFGFWGGSAQYVLLLFSLPLLIHRLMKTLFPRRRRCLPLD